MAHRYPPHVTLTGFFHDTVASIPSYVHALKNLAQAFSWLAQSPARADAIRLKDWLHLSLAYEFLPEQHASLEALAHAMVHPGAPVGWELRFYERFGQDEWRCHTAWPLDLKPA